MKSIEVSITEIDKGTKQLTLLNLREEIVNVLYKDTVAFSTKTDLLFFVLLFFISVKVEGKSLLSSILEDAIPKFKKLNKEFSEKKRKLNAGEYRKFVDENDLGSVFKYDVFFILVEAVLKIEEIEEKFKSLLEKDKEIKAEIKGVKEKYLLTLEEEFDSFQEYEIKDDRYDDDGNHHDLSKSVYRTIKMRNSRNLDLNLQKYTSVKHISSRSPIDFTFVQYVDIQIIFDLWDKYHLAEYVALNAEKVLNIAKNHFEFKVNFGDLILGWILWKTTSSKRKKQRIIAKDSFEQKKKKKENTEILTEAASILVSSILHADQQLKKEIQKIKRRISTLSKRGADIDEQELEQLKQRLANLENLKISSKLLG